MYPKDEFFKECFSWTKERYRILSRVYFCTEIQSMDLCNKLLVFPLGVA
jgi:hypothetical protein